MGLVTTKAAVGELGATMRSLFTLTLRFVLRRVHPTQTNERHWFNDSKTVLASSLVSRLANERLGGRHAIKTLIKHPRESWALVLVWRRTPQLVINLTKEDRSEFIDILKVEAHLDFIGHEPISVLDLRELETPYLVGKDRQALRTNKRRALRDGCTATVVPLGMIRDQTNRELRAILPGGLDQSPLWPIKPNATHVAVVGKDCDGKYLVAAVARCSGDVAVLEMFVRVNVTPMTSDCRFLVQSALVEALQERGVSYLLAGGTFRLSRGLQYLQHLEGFKPFHVSIN